MTSALVDNAGMLLKFVDKDLPYLPRGYTLINVDNDTPQQLERGTLRWDIALRTFIPVPTHPVEEVKDTVTDRLSQALQANKAWLNRGGNPTNAQTLAHIDRLTKQCNGLIQLLLGETFDRRDLLQEAGDT